MPDAYAHYRFGKEVYNCLPFVYRKPLERYRELFDIGLHGPDILFYYWPLSSNPVNQLGYDSHEQPASGFFQKMKELYIHTENKEALKAYLYGFICHFTLDSTCHPYIEKMIAKSSFTHSEIETELERFLMEKDGLDPMHHIKTQHIHATYKNAQVIAPCFESLTPLNIKIALKSMILSIRLLQTPEEKDFKRSLIDLALRISGRYKSMQGLIMKPEANEDCRNYCILLGKLFTESVTVATSLIQQYTNVLEGKAELSSRFDLTFGAGEHWEKLLL